MLYHLSHQGPRRASLSLNTHKPKASFPRLHSLQLFPFGVNASSIWPTALFKEEKPLEYLVYALSYSRVQPSANPVLQNIPSIHFPPAPHPATIRSTSLELSWMPWWWKQSIAWLLPCTLASPIPSLSQTAARVPPSIIKTAYWTITQNPLVISQLTPGKIRSLGHDCKIL